MSLLDVPAVREPEDRPKRGRRQAFHLGKDTTQLNKALTAVLTQVSGTVGTECTRCAKGNGLWKGCIVLPGQVRGAQGTHCANCVYGGRHSDYEWLTAPVVAQQSSDASSGEPASQLAPAAMEHARPSTFQPPSAAARRSAAEYLHPADFVRFYREADTEVRRALLGNWITVGNLLSREVEKEEEEGVAAVKKNVREGLGEAAAQFEGWGEDVQKMFAPSTPGGIHRLGGKRRRVEQDEDDDDDDEEEEDGAFMAPRLPESLSLPMGERSSKIRARQPPATSAVDRSWIASVRMPPSPTPTSRKRPRK